MIKFGTAVRVTNTGNHDHCFKKGDIVISNGDNFGENSRGFWCGFENKETDLFQYLLPEHYEVIEPEAEKVSGEIAEAVVDKDIPTKVTYAVFKKNGKIAYSGEDRDTAREVKAALGGKRKGVRIFLYAASKEIR